MEKRNVEGGRVLEKRERTETIIAWSVIAFLVGIMFLRVFIAIWTVGDRPRTWSYRTAPQIPAEAYSSTLASAATTEQAPPQVTLPPPAVGRKATGKGTSAPAGPTQGKAPARVHPAVPPPSSMPAPAGG